MQAREVGAGPRRQLPPIPAKPRGSAGAECETYDTQVLVALCEPASLGKRSMPPRLPLDSMQSLPCTQDGKHTHQQAEAGRSVQPVPQQQLQYQQQEEIQQHILHLQDWGSQSQQHLHALLPPPMWSADQSGEKRQECPPDISWQSLLPGALCDSREAAKSPVARGSKSSSEAQILAESALKASTTTTTSSSSSSRPELTLHASGLIYTSNHDLASQQQQQHLTFRSQLTPEHSCNGSFPFDIPGGLSTAVLQGTSTSKSRLGRVTGSEVPHQPLQVHPGMTCSCAGGDGIAQRQHSWSQCRDGAAHWALQRATTSCNSLSSDGLSRRLRIHIATFNMAGKVPPTLPGGLLGLPPHGQQQEQVDLYVFATQESGNISEWERLLAASLPAGGSYERLAWQTLRAIHLVLFASHRFRRQVLGIRGSAVATGIGNLVGNKGAVALSVQLVDYKLLFVSSHFAAHDDKVDRRNADFQRIKAGLFSSSSSSSILTDMGAATGSHTSPCSTPALVATLPLQQAAETRTPDRSSKAACTSGQRMCAGETADAAGGATCSSRQGTTGSFMPLGVAAWMSGLWDAVGRPGASCSGCPGSVGVFPCPSSGSECASLAAHSDAESSTLSQLRAASCPPDPEGAYQRHQEADHLNNTRATMTSCSGACTPSSTTPRPTLTPRWADRAAPFECSSAGHNSKAGLSIAEELRGQLSFLKSFVVRKPSSSVLGSRNGGTGGATSDHDVVFWVGDLNYRINGNSRAVGYLLSSRLHEVLHANDQLRLQQKKGKVFQGYQEGKIHFPPTFKFLQGTSQYSKQRVPSWTDRILWRVREPEPWADELAPTVQQTYYTSVPEVISSDHKPVVAGFELLLTAAEVPCVETDKHSVASRCSIM